ncbi:MAG: alanine racemase [Steroidobacteraceae bacterium]
MSRLIRARIDTAALRANFARIRTVAAGRRVIAVVKANGYGHGAVTVARALDAADAFGVARLEEGIELRAAGVTHPILLLEGVVDAGQLQAAADHRLDLVVHEPGQIGLLEAWRGPRQFALWAKLDTGMNRLGFRVEDFAAALARLAALTVPASRLRVMTHFACADERDSPATRAQLARFTAMAAPLGLETSLCNSAGIFGWPEAHGDWVRPGLSLYGVSPFAGESAASLGLAPVMTLTTTVIAVRRVARGESVGYGELWRAARDSRVAILAAGYADGLPRGLPGGTPVVIHDRRVPLVGRVSMDMIAVDVTDLPGVEVGAAAELWGPALAAEEVAASAGTLAYELLCGVAPRVAYVTT